MRKNVLLVLVCALFVNLSLAQDASKILEIRVSVIHNTIAEASSVLMGIGTSFINKSDQDIYIPRINAFWVDQPGYLMNVYMKDSASNYVPFPFSSNITLSRNESGRHFYRNPVSGVVILTAEMGQHNRERYQREVLEIKSFIENNKLPIEIGLFEDANKALFLKAGEERAYYYTFELKSSEFTAGEYLFVYEPSFSDSIGEGYPETMMGFKKFIPTGIESNRLYLNLKNVEGPLK